MQLTEISFDTVTPIDGYGPGFFRVAGQVIQGGTLVTATRAVAWAGYDDTAPLFVLADQIDVLFVGTGAEMAHLPAVFRSTLEEAGLAVEHMSSPAAARTYNVLLAEGRRIAAALLPVG